MCTIKLLRHVRLGMVRFSSISSSQNLQRTTRKRQFEPSARSADVRPPPDDPHRPRQIRPHPRLICHLSLARCCKRRREATASSSSTSSSSSSSWSSASTLLASSRLNASVHIISSVAQKRQSENKRKKKQKTVMTCETRKKGWLD